MAELCFEIALGYTALPPTDRPRAIDAITNSLGEEKLGSVLQGMLTMTRGRGVPAIGSQRKSRSLIK
jgi:hypothetical protein